MNNNLISTTRHMQSTVQELYDADVTVLSAGIDMDYNTPRPHPFRFYIHAWYDENFARWAMSYHTEENEQRHKISVPWHKISVPFLDGQVYVLYD